MLFNSFEFLIFFPVIVIIYFLIPRKIRCFWLLAASYFFYMCWNVKYALLLFFSTFVTWICGFILQTVSEKNWSPERILFYKKGCVAASFFLNLSILFFFKYFNFTVGNLNFLLDKIHTNFRLPVLDLILPVGISFYTFQALGYTVDVYRQEIEAEKNFFRYALFVSFFPQLVAGPIERSKNLLLQLKNLDKLQVWNYERIRSGLSLMLWGFFQKLVIADRISIVVKQVFDHYQEFGCVELACAAILFSFQIYCDFGGYSNIAKGAAEVMGIQLMNNFRQPYFAQNIKSFWRRWHISLTSWFTDYLYIPLGGNRKGKTRQFANILIVFLCSGLWHGANWTYVVWGLLHGCAQIAGSLNSGHSFPLRPKKHAVPAEKKPMPGIGIRLLKTTFTFSLVTVFWVFFRADTMGQALDYFVQCLRYRRLQSFTDMGLNPVNWYVLLASLFLLLLVDILHERGISLRQKIGSLNFLLRGIVYLGAIWSVILFGIYGYQYDASQFIYFQF